MSNNYKPQIEARSGIERTLDHGFYWTAKILAFAIAGVLIWITIQVGLKAMPAIQEFGLGFLFRESSYF